MTTHQDRVRITVTTAHPGQDIGIVAVSADLVPISLSPTVSTPTEARRFPEPIGDVDIEPARVMNLQVYS